MTPVDIPDTAADAVVNATAGAVIAPKPIATATNGITTAQKKVAEVGLKAKPAEDDPTDDDVSNMFELVKLAIKEGAEVTPIDLKEFIPHFQEEVKLKTKKYTNAKIVSFFTGGTFTFLMYLLIEYLKTIG